MQPFSCPNLKLHKIYTKITQNSTPFKMRHSQFYGVFLRWYITILCSGDGLKKRGIMQYKSMKKYRVLYPGIMLKNKGPFWASSLFCSG